MSKYRVLSYVIILMVGLNTLAFAAVANDQDAVAVRGRMVMPFDLARTHHVFSKTRSGGVELVVTKKPNDVEQRDLIRHHLSSIAKGFAHGDFSPVSAIHGSGMPGLAALQAAKTDEIAYRYRDIADGGEIIYVSTKPALVTAIHTWFDAQLRDHGHDASAGMHSNHMDEM